MPGFNVGGGRDPQQTYAGVELNRASRWRIKTLVAAEGKSLINDSTMLFAKSLTLPVYSVEEEMALGGSINYKFAKTVAWEDVKVTFYDVQHTRGSRGQASILEQIYKARQKVWTPDTGLQYASAYKGDSIFFLTDGDGSSSWSFTLKNSWIKSVSHSDMSYDSSAIKEVTITLSYDWAVEGDETDKVEDKNFMDKPKKTKKSSPFEGVEGFLAESGYPGQSEPSGERTSSKEGPGRDTPANPAQERAEKAKADRATKAAKLAISRGRAQAELEALSINPRAFG